MKRAFGTQEAESDDGMEGLDVNADDRAYYATHQFKPPPQKSFSFSEEQEAILDCAAPPSNNSSYSSTNSCNKIIRVFAGAGTGKTTTLVEYAKRLAQNGHRSITYLTFNRNNVVEAKAHFGSFPIDTRTLHSQAFSVLRGSDPAGRARVVDEDQLERIINAVCDDAIEEFLSGMPRSSYNEVNARDRAIRLVRLYIKKTLQQNWLQSDKSLAEYTPDSFNSIYFPGALYHENKSKPPPPQGFPNRNYKEFYVKQVKILWKLMTDVDACDAARMTPFRTHDSIMKQAQLDDGKIECSALLVDESQDMNACQVAFIAAQRKHGTHIIVVGDAVQSIYSFRGARSQVLMAIPNCQDRKLTRTFRFGPEIAAMANTLLYCKEISPQTTYFTKQGRKSWYPYRLSGQGLTGVVTARPIVDGNWPAPDQPDIDTVGSETASGDSSSATDAVSADYEYPVTILAFANLDLFMFATTHLIGKHKSPGGPELKISINGGGENSGKGQWRKIKKLLENFFNIYRGMSTTLPYNHWRDVHGLTWAHVVADVRDFELSNYQQVVGLIETYKESTLAKFNQFDECVLRRRIHADDADIVLSTIHAAKGLEWDHVMILDDSMAELSQYKFNPRGSCNRVVYPASQTQIIPSRCDAVLNWAHFGDNYNLWYVALTRAKKRLCVPPKFMALITDMLSVRDLIRSISGDPSPSAAPPTSQPSLSRGSVPAAGIGDDLMLPEAQSLSTASVVVLAESTSSASRGSYVIGGKTINDDEMQGIWHCIVSCWVDEIKLSNSSVRLLIDDIDLNPVIVNM